MYFLIPLEIEQTSKLACASGHRPDGSYEGAATHRWHHLPILYGKECSYNKQTASIIQPIELSDQSAYHLIPLASE